jgi:hypothetical protein
MVRGRRAGYSNVVTNGFTKPECARSNRESNLHDS